MALRRRISLLAVLPLVATLGCGGGAAPTQQGIPVGLLLSFSGFLAASSINSERALILALEAANAAGGVGGKPLYVIARDTRSDAALVAEPARQLVEAGAAILIGPDTTDLATALRPILEDRTMLLPSFATSSDIDFKPAPWFVMGPSVGRVACELVAQLRADGRQNPLVIVNPSGYNSRLSWDLVHTYGMPKFVLPRDRSPNTADVHPLTSVAADAFILAAFPRAGSALVNALATLGALGDPTRWYLSPTLHTPAFIRGVPVGLLINARGVAPGTTAGAAAFRDAFQERWHDTPFDDAYPFFDAGAVAALALERALGREGAIPSGTGLSKHVMAVTRSGATPITWSEIGRGLQLLRSGQEVSYVGLLGSMEFDSAGLTPSASTKWWTIAPEGFADRAGEGDCRR